MPWITGNGFQCIWSNTPTNTVPCVVLFFFFTKGCFQSEQPIRCQHANSGTQVQTLHRFIKHLFVTTWLLLFPQVKSVLSPCSASIKQPVLLVRRLHHSLINMLINNLSEDKSMSEILLLSHAQLTYIQAAFSHCISSSNTTWNSLNVVNKRYLTVRWGTSVTYVHVSRWVFTSRHANVRASWRSVLRTRLHQSTLLLFSCPQCSQCFYAYLQLWPPRSPTRSL